MLSAKNLPGSDQFGCQFCVVIGLVCIGIAFLWGREIDVPKAIYICLGALVLGKIKGWFAKSFQRVRLAVALAFTMLSNGYWVGFMQGKIYQGPLKMGCIPGLNCYACPGALGSCPIGAMQNCLAGVNRRPSFVVLGYLLVFGSILGRVVCGWLCPIGLIQDALQYLRPVSKRGRSLRAQST